MRFLAIPAVFALALAATPAAAACSDPAGAPAVVGKVFVGFFALGSSPPHEQRSARMRFNPDCTVTQTLGDGGGLIPKTATWTRDGDVLVIERAEPKAAGGKVVYAGKVGARGEIAGRWGPGEGRNGFFGLQPGKGDQPCGKPGPAGDLSASSYRGKGKHTRGVEALLSIDFNANCSVKLTGTSSYQGSWRQEGDSVTFKVAGRSWRGTITGKTIAGPITLQQGAEAVVLFVSPADLADRSTSPPAVVGAPGGTFTVTRDK